MGEIITDAYIDCEEKEQGRCQGCGACKNACPAKDIGGCLSALTQKKGDLTPFEIEAIKSYGYAWGCDKCQEGCPHTLRAIKNGTIFTNIDFFKNDTLASISVQDIDRMSDEQFSERAYSWRGKATVLRNLKILETVEKE